ncbi:MAG: hypothetical protein K9K37_02595, partial [Desulfocapsa sp.]|nr:hypothetical protein [Desulfocapsa sp.]
RKTTVREKEKEFNWGGSLNRCLKISDHRLGGSDFHCWVGLFLAGGNSAPEHFQDDLNALGIFTYSLRKDVFP